MRHEMKAKQFTGNDGFDMVSAIDYPFALRINNCISATLPPCLENTDTYKGSNHMCAYM